MKKTLTWIQFGLFIVLLIVVIWRSWPVTDADNQGGELSGTLQPSHALVNESAPIVRLPDMNEMTRQIGGPDRAGRLVLLNFWASWCGPCEIEMPDLQALADEYEGKLIVVGVNSTSDDKERQARQFIVERNLTFPVVFDRAGEALEQYVIDGYPTSFLLNGDGVIVERVNGVIALREWKKKIDKQLASANE